MRHTTIVILFLSMFITSCGKSPLLNKLEKNIQEVSGGILLGEHFPNQKVDFTLTWNSPPSLDELGSFEVELTAPLKNSQTLNAYIWMPDMGHGSSPIEKTQVNNNHYSFSEVAFIMPGLWVLHIEILEDNQIVDEWQKPITL